jgi:hypothetical protein
MTPIDCNLNRRLSQGDPPPLMALVPPFTAASALQKVKLAQNLWNTRNPAKVALAYTPDTIWRNRTTFLQGRKEVEQFLTKKWEKEHLYMYGIGSWLVSQLLTSSSDLDSGRSCFRSRTTKSQFKYGSDIYPSLCRQLFSLVLLRVERVSGWHGPMVSNVWSRGLHS